MNIKAWLGTAVMAGMLAGCGTQKAYDLELRHAHGALEADFPELAGKHLDKADKMAADRKITPDGRTTLLRAEVCLRSGDAAGAEQRARAVAKQYVPGTRRRAQAEEILAKADIRQGRFAEAREHLAEADRSYVHEPDKRRVADLEHLVRGLEAYALGRTAQAKQHWRAIDDPELKLSVSMNTDAN